MNRLRKYLLMLLFPELAKIDLIMELKQINKNVMFLTKILKQHDTILRNEIWEQIKSKYEGDKTD